MKDGHDFSQWSRAINYFIKHELNDQNYACVESLKDDDLYLNYVIQKGLNYII